MTVQMSGGRYDDRQWPVPWVNWEVSDEEGEGLVRCGAAMEVVLPPAPVLPERKSSPQAAAAHIAAEEAAAAAQARPPVTEKEAAAAAKAAAREPLPPPELEKNPPVPLPGDPVDAWREYAVSRGMTEAEAKSKNKTQLQAAYGGRL